jgi:hypothetical protein
MKQPDKLFKERLEQFESPAPISTWDRIESNLDRPNYKSLWLKVAAGIALLAIASFAWYVNSNKDRNDQQLASKDISNQSNEKANQGNTTDQKTSPEETQLTKQSQKVSSTPSKASPIVPKTVNSSANKELISKVDPPVEAITPVSISSTLAPRSVVVTVTTGRSTLGNKSTPNRRYEAKPITMGALTNMTVKIGRRIQRSQILIVVRREVRG